jgi:hypothetical protein
MRYQWQNKKRQSSNNWLDNSSDTLYTAIQKASLLKSFVLHILYQEIDMPFRTAIVTSFA